MRLHKAPNPDQPISFSAWSVENLALSIRQYLGCPRLFRNLFSQLNFQLKIATPPTKNIFETNGSILPIAAGLLVDCELYARAFITGDNCRVSPTGNTKNSKDFLTSFKLAFELLPANRVSAISLNSHGPSSWRLCAVIACMCCCLYSLSPEWNSVWVFLNFDCAVIPIYAWWVPWSSSVYLIVPTWAADNHTLPAGCFV